jgi:hypothetical protein
MFSKLLSLFFISLLTSTYAYSHEEMFFHGYKTCVACHATPSGGGIVSAYGRTIEYALSFKKNTSKVEMKKYRQGFRARVANADYEDRDSVQFLMQADYINEFRVNKKTNINSILTRRPPSLDTSNDISDNYYFRRALVTHKVDRNKTIEFGRDLLNFGIMDVNHKIYNRDFNKRDYDDFPTQVRYFLSNKQYGQSMSMFFPSYQEPDGNEEYGLNYKIEKYYKDLSLGLSSLAAKTKTIERIVIAPHLKLKWKKLLLLTEIDLTFRDIEGAGNNQKSIWTKLTYFYSNYLRFFIGAEKLRRNAPYDQELKNISMGSYFRYDQNISLRIDYKNEVRNGFNEKLIMGQFVLHYM